MKLFYKGEIDDNINFQHFRGGQLPPLVSAWGAHARIWCEGARNEASIPGTDTETQKTSRDNEENNGKRKGIPFPNRLHVLGERRSSIPSSVWGTACRPKTI